MSIIFYPKNFLLWNF